MFKHLTHPRSPTGFWLWKGSATGTQVTVPGQARAVLAGFQALLATSYRIMSKNASYVASWAWEANPFPHEHDCP